MIFGSGLAAILLNDWLCLGKYDLYLYIVSCAVALCLIKQSGVLMSFFLLLMQYVMGVKNVEVQQKYKDLTGMFLVGAVRMIWGLHCNFSEGAFKNSTPIYVCDLITMFFRSGNENMDSVKQRFFKAFFDINTSVDEYEAGMRLYFTIGDSNIKISYCLLLMIFILMTVLLFYYFKELDCEFATRFKIILFFIVGYAAIWEIGTLATYVFEFSEHDKKYLIDFFRYKNTLFLSALIFLIVASAIAFAKTRNIGIRKSFSIMLACFFLMSIPWSEVYRWLSRDLVRESIALNDWHEENVSHGGKRGIYVEYMKIFNE